MVVLDDNRSTGWLYSMTTGVQGGCTQLQREYRVVFSDNKRSTGLTVLDDNRSTGW